MYIPGMEHARSLPCAFLLLLPLLPLLQDGGLLREGDAAGAGRLPLPAVAGKQAAGNGRSQHHQSKGHNEGDQ